MTQSGGGAMLQRPIDDLEETLITKVHHYLESYVYDNAVFLAERLVAHNRTDEHIHLLATCYHRSGQLNRAIAVLEDAKRLEQNRFLLALCCFQQGKLVDAENALLGVENRLFGDLQAKENIPNGAAGFWLMGRICRRANRPQHAIDCFMKSLAIDPCMYAAYEQLCELGANVDASRFFGTSTYFSNDRNDESENNSKEDDDEDDDSREETSQNTKSNRTFKTEDPSDDEFATPEPRGLTGLATPEETASMGLSTRFSSAKPPSNFSYKTPVTGSSHNAAGVAKKPRVTHGGGAPANSRLRKSLRRPLSESDDPYRRNTRPVFSSAISEEGFSKPKSDSASTPLATRLFHQEETPEESRTVEKKSKTINHRGLKQLLMLLSSFGSIYQKLSVYMCREALDMLERLPANQKASGWCQHQIGRAYFEMADYNQAHDVFQNMLRMEPHRMAGLDLYSTTLWHLKKEVELSYLAQQVTDFDKFSCEAWCVAGNCFSLQKEHDTALTFFQRAIQLDPSFTYAYTLSGHEYVANEDFEKATNCYRHAIRTDPRHYNAWYGLGTIYYRQEKFEFAEYHFKRALEINPRSSLLYCFLGMVLHSTRKFDEALRVLAIASQLQPLNPQARFQRANVLITLQRYEEALTELKIVRNFAPRESSVHFMMGNVAKKLGRVDDAMRFYTTALYFHPKDNNLIKSAIEKIHEPDLDEDDHL